MIEASERYRVVAGGFTARLDGMTAEAWSAPSPCAEWPAGDVVVHVVGTQRAVLSSLLGTDPAEVDASGDLMAQWVEIRDAVTAAVEDEATSATTVKGMFGDQPFGSLVGRLLCCDTLVHTWDLARATGQDERLDQAAVTACRQFLEPVDEAIRRPGGFGAKIEPVPGADEQTAFLNFCGRSG